MNMRGHAMGGGRGGGWSGMRTMRQDRTVLQHRVKKGTARRMLTFAVPYRTILAIFLPVVILDAAIGAVNPLILRALIDNGIYNHDTQLVIELAVLVGGPCARRCRPRPDRAPDLRLYRREPDLRHAVQGLPSHPAHAAGVLHPYPDRRPVSRLNNDVIGAQQAFTDLLSNVVGNLVTVVIVLGAMFFLSWQITLAALILLPIFLLPARFVGQRIGSLTKEGYNLNSEMNMVMQERFNVGGAMLVKLLGRPEAEAAVLRGRRPAGCATSASPSPPMPVSSSSRSRSTASFATALVYGFGGVAAVHGALQVGTVVALAQLPHPPLPTADPALERQSRRHDRLVSFERLFEVLDIVPDDQRGPRRGRRPAGPRLDRVRPRRLRLSRSAEEVSLASLESVAVLEAGPATRCSTTSRSRVEPGQMVALVGPVGSGEDHHLEPRAPPLRRDRLARCASTGSTSATPRWPRCRDVVGVVTQDPAPLPRHAAGEPAVRPTRGDRGRRARRRSTRPRSATSSTTSPTASTR